MMDQELSMTASHTTAIFAILFIVIHTITEQVHLQDITITPVCRIFTNIVRLVSFVVTRTLTIPQNPVTEAPVAEWVFYRKMEISAYANKKSI